jgi:hypothetical protein
MQMNSRFSTGDSYNNDSRQYYVAQIQQWSSLVIDARVILTRSELLAITARGACCGFLSAATALQEMRARIRTR